MCHWTIHFQYKEKAEWLRGKQTRLKSLTDSMSASILTSQQLSQWSPQIYTAIIKAKADSYFNENGYLSNTTTVKDPKNTKCACLLMFSCWVVGYKHLLIQLWINRVTAEGLYWVLWTYFAVTFQLETHQSLAPLFSLGLHRGPAICHTARARTHTHTLTMHTLYAVYEQHNAQTHPQEKKDLRTSLQWHKH